MNPWTIIGWIVLGVMHVCCAFILGRVLYFWARNMWRHIRTRGVHPEAGQVWIQEGCPLHIDRVVTTDGEWRVVIKTGLPGGSQSSWSDSMDGWKRRVRNRRLWLKGAE